LQPTCGATGLCASRLAAAPRGRSTPALGRFTSAFLYAGISDRGWRLGAGPERLLDGGLVDELRAAGHEVRIEYVEADSDAPAEIRTAFELNRAWAGRVRDAREADAIPVVLAGNCMTAVGTLARLGATPAVLWFDLHADFNTPETTASGFPDGMALAMLTGRCWANLARTVHGSQPVPERDVVLLGTRDWDAGERVLLDGSEIALRAPEQARTQLAPVLARLSGREAYVHVDLDEDLSRRIPPAGYATRRHFASRDPTDYGLQFAKPNLQSSVQGARASLTFWLGGLKGNASRARVRRGVMRRQRKGRRRLAEAFVADSGRAGDRLVLAMTNGRESATLHSARMRKAGL
jgi:arginase